ncbi:antibiotic biosynthesis monooxygenase family protein [Gephyromycinifex aptenodytis]|uniref:antibiotic biosynthesis monooxygenase family protein n=1 Tax=Gephyromycinifex aptenodytis TaxID=2716227 RepID=UPI0014489333|nr:antibiotic biosynthesis monooxygenase [Gephyromycinifex aptenodytis]
MSSVKINAMHIAEGRAAEFLERFSARPGKIEHVDGFEGFKVLRPTDERATWLVVTQWRDDAAYEAWYGQRPHRDPNSVTYADGWELWSYEVLEDVAPATS